MGEGAQRAQGHSGGTRRRRTAVARARVQILAAWRRPFAPSVKVAKSWDATRPYRAFAGAGGGVTRPYRAFPGAGGGVTRPNRSFPGAGGGVTRPWKSPFYKYLGTQGLSQILIWKSGTPAGYRNFNPSTCRRPFSTPPPTSSISSGIRVAAAVLELQRHSRRSRRLRSGHPRCHLLDPH